MGICACHVHAHWHEQETSIQSVNIRVGVYSMIYCLHALFFSIGKNENDIFLLYVGHPKFIFISQGSNKAELFLPYHPIIEHKEIENKICKE